MLVMECVPPYASAGSWLADPFHFLYNTGHLTLIYWPTMLMKEFHTQQNFQSAVLNCIHRLLPVDGKRFSIDFPDARPDHNIASDKVVMEMTHAYDSRFRKHDPMAPDHFDEMDTAVITNTMLMPDREWKQTFIFRKFFQPHGFFHDADIFLRRERKIVAVLTLLRSDECHPFTVAEIKLLANLQPFIEYALDKMCLSQPAYDMDLHRHFRLTGRESEVAKSSLNGVCNKKLAQQLGISIPTLRTHLQSIYLKMGVHSNGEMISKLLNMMH